MADTPTQNDAPSLPPQAGNEIGYSGTYNYKGYITGEEYARDLQGKYALQVFDTMRRSDPTVHAILLVCKNPIIGADWNLEPASDDPIDIEIAESISRELFERKIQFANLVRECLQCLEFGHSVFEKILEITEYNNKPLIGLKAIKSRKQRSILNWAINNGADPGITQILQTGQNVEIPRSKLLVVTNEQEGDNYEGISLLRFAYKSWKIKDALDLMLAIALEQNAVGTVIIKKGVQNGATTNISVGEPELAKLRSAVRARRSNEESYIELPQGVELDMLDMQGMSTSDILPAIEHHDTQITLSVLAQFLMLGQGGSSGSRAVSADHSALFIKALEAVARTVQQAIQLDVVNYLVDLNYSNLQNGYPKLVFSDLSDDDVEQTSSAVASLMSAGAITKDRDMENRLRAMLNLPPLSEDMYDNYDEQHAKQIDLPTTALDDPAPTSTTPDKKTDDVDDAKKTVPTDTQTKADLRDYKYKLIQDVIRASDERIERL